MDKLIELQDIINVKDLPREIKPGDCWVLCYDGIRDNKMLFAFKNIGGEVLDNNNEEDAK